MGKDGKTKIRMAFIGCGAHSRGALQPSAMLIDEIDLVAVCDLDPERLNYTADRWRIPARYTKWEEMLEKETLDAVAVVLHPWDTAPMAKRVLERGFNLFMEKPPAVSVEIAADLAAAARSSGKTAMMATMWRHSPPFTRARELMSKDDFGKPTQLEGRFHCLGPRYANEQQGFDGAWHFLLYQGVHLVDATRSLCGDIATVSAHLNGEPNDFRSYGVSLKFASGATGTLSMAARHVHYTMFHRVVGESGASVEINDLRELINASAPHWSGDRINYSNHLERTWRSGPNDPSFQTPGYVEELRLFAHCLLNGGKPRADLDDGLAAMKTLKAIYDSGQKGGAPVNVE